MPSRLYMTENCPRCATVRAAMDRLGVEYRTVEVSPGDRQEVRRISGQDSLPVLADDQSVVAGSTAILRYLVNSANGSDLLPDDSRGQALAWLLEGYAGGVLAPLVERAREEGGWPPPPREKPSAGTEGEAPPPASPAGPGASARGRLLQELGTVEGLLSGHDYVLGDSPTLADLALHAHLGRLAEGGTSPIPEGYPRLRSWYARLRS